MISTERIAVEEDSHGDGDVTIETDEFVKEKIETMRGGT